MIEKKVPHPNMYTFMKMMYLMLPLTFIMLFYQTNFWVTYTIGLVWIVTMSITLLNVFFNRVKLDPKTEKEIMGADRMMLHFIGVKRHPFAFEAIAILFTVSLVLMYAYFFV